MRVLRFIDTGIHAARRNVATTAALTELHQTGRIPDTLRLHAYPRSILIGRHQMLTRTINMAEVQKRRLEVARRVTGGGAVYMAPGVIAWDLVTSRKRLGDTLAKTGAVVCGAVAAGLSRLGLAARYRAANEIEVGGRRIAGASGYFDGPSVVYQGALLIDADLEEMASVLALPTSKPLPALRERLVTMKELLGRVPEETELTGALIAGLSDTFRCEVSREQIGEEERLLAQDLHDGEIGTDEFVEGLEQPGAGVIVIGRDAPRGGAVEAHISLHGGADRRIDQVWLAGEFTVTPARAILDIEAALRGLPLQAASERALVLLSDRAVELRGATRFDIATAIADAALERSRQKPGGKSRSRRA